jgi:aspartyl-tRNA(Asn)/glutamyl-tRNA(Gln) amidotransferase subunit A
MHRRIMAVEVAEHHRKAFADHPDSYGPKIAGLIRDGLAVSAVDYAAALKHRRQFLVDVNGCFDAEHDIWLTPATTSSAPARETTGDPAFNSPWSYCGYPTLSLPCGVTDDGLPVGLQLIARAGCEERLLRAGRWSEHVLPPLPTPPGVSGSPATS